MLIVSFKEPKMQVIWLFSLIFKDLYVFYIVEYHEFLCFFFIMYILDFYNTNLKAQDFALYKIWSILHILMLSLNLPCKHSQVCLKHIKIE